MSTLKLFKHHPVFLRMNFAFAMGLFLCANVYSQSFAPVGALWHYGVGWAWSSDITYRIAKSEKDTVVRNKKCTLIKSIPFCGMYGGDETYVYHEDSIVYFLNSQTQDFQILYNYKGKKGTAWVLNFINNGELDSIRVLIDSSYFISVNNKKLIKQNITYTIFRSSSYSYKSEVIEQIGDVGYLFLFFNIHIVCDADFTLGLRCYKDDSLGLYKASQYSCDYTNVSINQLLADYNIISPNPCSEYFKISGAGISKYYLYNSLGEIIFKENIIFDGFVDMSKFSPGLYFVKIYKPNGRFHTLKVIKNPR